MAKPVITVVIIMAVIAAPMIAVGIAVVVHGKGILVPIILHIHLVPALILLVALVPVREPVTKVLAMRVRKAVLCGVPTPAVMHMVRNIVLVTPKAVRGAHIHPSAVAVQRAVHHRVVHLTKAVPLQTVLGPSIAARRPAVHMVLWGLVQLRDVIPAITWKVAHAYQIPRPVQRDGLGIQPGPGHGIPVHGIIRRVTRPVTVPCQRAH